MGWGKEVTQVPRKVLARPWLHLSCLPFRGDCGLSVVAEVCSWPSRASACSLTCPVSRCSFQGSVHGSQRQDEGSQAHHVAVGSDVRFQAHFGSPSTIGEMSAVSWV